MTEEHLEAKRKVIEGLSLLVDGLLDDALLFSESLKVGKKHEGYEIIERAVLCNLEIARELLDKKDYKIYIREDPKIKKLRDRYELICNELKLAYGLNIDALKT